MTFAQLLASGQIGPGQPLVLGLDRRGSPITGSWLDLFSVGIGGLSGSGKSWTGAYLLSQAMLNGARVAMLDPHAGDSESISSRLAPFAGTGRYLCAVADTPQTMRSTIAMVTDELTRRKHGTGEQVRGRRVPWIILCDEFSALMRGDLAEPLAGLFEAIAQEGRKLRIYGMALGQVWTATRSGGTEVRDSLASAYLHRLRPSQARYLSGLTAADLPADIHELPAGTAYLSSTAGDLTRITVPRMNDSDIQRVAGFLTGAHPTMGRLPTDDQEPAQPADVGARGKPDGSPLAAGTEQATTASQRDKTASPEVSRAAALFLDGHDLPAIVYELREVKSNAGRRYQTAVTEVQQLIREGLGWKSKAA